MGPLGRKPLPAFKPPDCNAAASPSGDEVGSIWAAASCATNESMNVNARARPSYLIACLRLVHTSLAGGADRHLAHHCRLERSPCQNSTPPPADRAIAAMRDAKLVASSFLPMFVT